MCFVEHVLFQRGYFRLGQSHLFSSKMPVNYQGLASFLLILFILVLKKLPEYFFGGIVEALSAALINGPSRQTLFASLFPSTNFHLVPQFEKSQI